MSRDVKVDLIKIEEIRDQYLSGEFDYEQKVELLCEINPEKDLEPEIIDTLILDGEISNLESYVTREKASLIFDEVYMYYSDIPDEYIGYIPVTDLLEYSKWKCVKRIVKEIYCIFLLAISISVSKFISDHLGIYNFIIKFIAIGIISIVISEVVYFMLYRFRDRIKLSEI